MQLGGWVIGVLCGMWAATPASPERSPLPATPAVPVTVADGQGTVTLGGSKEGTDYLMVVGSLVPRGKPSVVRFDAASAPIDQVSPLSSAEPSERPAWWTWRVENDRRQMIQARRAAPTASSYSTARFAAKRSFHLFVGEADLYDTQKYTEVSARLAQAGRYCLVYVDEKDQVAQELIDDVVNTFDERVYLSARERFGEHRDVDRNGKFTILITGWLERLSGGKVSLSGFVRGADFYRDVAAPYSNQCDMMYLSASLTPGEHMRTVLAHEYTHAITFCEHTFGEYLAGAQGQDEEAWLSEAIAHLAENMHGEGWSNLDYRMSTYLSDTGAYRLVVPDYFQDGLWRSHGCRGATYLFLRYLVDRYGPNLLTELSRSNLEGIANIETATQTPFAELFRAWSVHLAASGALGHPYEMRATSVPIFGRVGERLLAGPRPEVMSNHAETALAPTSWTSLIIHVPAGEARTVTLRGSAEADLQWTIVPIPAARPRVELAVHPAADRPTSPSDDVRLVLISDQEVRWQSISWERAQLRQERPRENEKLARISAARELLVADAQSKGTWISDRVNLSEFAGDPVVFKVVGIDLQGRYVSAWAQVAAQSSSVLTASPRSTR